jgi:hypothetical protein
MVSSMTSANNTDIVPLIRSLYPNSTEEELRDAQQALSEYVAVVLRIFDRLEAEKQSDSSKSDTHVRV